MLRRSLCMFIMITLFLTVSGCMSDSEITDIDKNNKTELFISAASSLTDAMFEIKKAYEKENTHLSLIFNFGGSGKLAQQIEQGAPIDVYISADQKWMDQLQDKSIVKQDTRIDLVSNQLIVIKAAAFKTDISSFNEINTIDYDQIAMGDPASVPAGHYAKQALENIAQWKNIQPKLVYAKDVRQVVTYVETGNAEIGIVYLSDALTAKNIKIVTEVSRDLHSPILYPAGIIASSKHIKEAEHFIEFLQSETAQQILTTYGFTKPE